MDPWQAKDYVLADAIIDDGKSGLVAPTPDPTSPPEVNYLLTNIEPTQRRIILLIFLIWCMFCGSRFEQLLI
jgi:DNA-binding HxlR family transcriptional regulator